MSITHDRSNLATVLHEPLTALGVSVYLYAPSVMSAKIAWLEPVSITPDKTFGSLTITWQLTITAPANTTAARQQQFLDAVTDAALDAVTQDAASLSHIDEYIALYEPSNSATYPAVRLTLTSFTPIGKGE